MFRRLQVGCNLWETFKLTHMIDTFSQKNITHWKVFLEQSQEINTEQQFTLRGIQMKDSLQILCLPFTFRIPLLWSGKWLQLTQFIH